MAAIEALRAKRVWIGLAAAVLTVLLLCALGALLMVRDIVPQEGCATWICGSYAVAGLIGAWIAARGAKGTLIRALTVAGLLILLLCLLSWICTGGIRLEAGGWMPLLAIVIGCLVAGMCRSGGKKKRSSIPHTGKQRALRRVQR